MPKWRVTERAVYERTCVVEADDISEAIAMAKESEWSPLEFSRWDAVPRSIETVYDEEEPTP